MTPTAFSKQFRNFQIAFLGYATLGLPGIRLDGTAVVMGLLPMQIFAKGFNHFINLGQVFLLKPLYDC